MIKVAPGSHSSVVSELSVGGLCVLAVDRGATAMQASSIINLQLKDCKGIIVMSLSRIARLLATAGQRLHETNVLARFQISGGRPSTLQPRTQAQQLFRDGVKSI